jgi:hypothetical protein
VLAHFEPAGARENGDRDGRNEKPEVAHADLVSVPAPDASAARQAVRGFTQMGDARG